MRVLIVDDHAAFRRSAASMLRTGGFDVVGEAEDAEGAATAVAELRPDVVLMDVHLGGVDGFEVTRRLLAERPSLRVVLISSRNAASVAPRLPGSGAVGFVTKIDLSAATLGAVIAGWST